MIRIAINTFNLVTNWRNIEVTRLTWPVSNGQSPSDRCHECSIGHAAAQSSPPLAGACMFICATASQPRNTAHLQGGVEPKTNDGNTTASHWSDETQAMDHTRSTTGEIGAGMEGIVKMCTGCSHLVPWSRLEQSSCKRGSENPKGRRPFKNSHSV
jgi:hypothetical protein